MSYLVYVRGTTAYRVWFGWVGFGALSHSAWRHDGTAIYTTWRLGFVQIKRTAVNRRWDATEEDEG